MKSYHRCIRPDEGKYREEGFPLARMKDGKQITFTQQDIREVQLAKAAIHSGIELLLEHAGISMGEIKKYIWQEALGYIWMCI